MTELHSNIKELIEITEALEGVKNYVKKNPYAVGAMAVSIPTSLTMMKHGSAITASKTAALAAGKTTKEAGLAALTATGTNTGGVSGTLLAAKSATAIPGSVGFTNSIASGISNTLNATGLTNINVGAISTMGISWLPIAAGLTAYGISRIVRHYKSLKYKEAKLKKLKEILNKLQQSKVNPNKIQKIKTHIQELSIEINAAKSVLRQQKQESFKQINVNSQNDNIKENPEKMKEIQKSKQVLSKMN